MRRARALGPACVSWGHPWSHRDSRGTRALGAQLTGAVQQWAVLYHAPC